MRRYRWIGLVVLLVAGCTADGDDRSGVTTTEAPACSPQAAGEERGPAGEVAIGIVGVPTFVSGEASPTLFAGGHDHTAGPVEEGEAHVHECLVIANGGTDDLVVQAIQILPAEGEEAYALYEADDLAAEFGMTAPEQDVVPAGGAVALELLAPVDPEAPPEAVRHRVAYTVMGPDGRRDLFVEGEPVEVSP